MVLEHSKRLQATFALLSFVVSEQMCQYSGVHCVKNNCKHHWSCDDALDLHKLWTSTLLYDLLPLYCDDRDTVLMLQKVFFCNEEFQTEEKPSTVKQTASH